MSKKLFCSLAFLLGFGIGMIATLYNGLSLTSALTNSLIFALVVLYAALISLWGMSLAIHKGYAEWLGFLLGLVLNLIGILILYILPRRSAQEPAGEIDRETA